MANTSEIVHQTEETQTVKLDTSYGDGGIYEIMATFKPESATIHIMVSGDKSKKFRLSAEAADNFAQAWTDYRLQQQRQHEAKLAEYTLKVAALRARAEKLGGTLTCHSNYDEMPYWFELKFDQAMQWYNMGSYDISMSGVEERLDTIEKRIANGSYPDNF